MMSTNSNWSFSSYFSPFSSLFLFQNYTYYYLAPLTFFKTYSRYFFLHFIRPNVRPQGRILVFLHICTCGNFYQLFSEFNFLSPAARIYKPFDQAISFALFTYLFSSLCLYVNTICVLINNGSMRE